MKSVYVCEEWKRLLDRRVGLGLGTLALLVYLITLSPGAFPGVSASLIATYTGLEPQLAPAHPIWGTLVGWLGRVPFLSLPVRLNLFSALCGAASVTLFYRLVSGLVHGAIESANETAEQRVRASVLAGTVAALALAFSKPLWVASTRIHFQSFDLLLLLLLTHLFLCFARTGKDRYLALFAPLYGVGIVESAGLIPFTPLFIIVAFHHWHRRDAVVLGRVLGLGLLGLLGLGLYALTAWRFCHTADISLRGYQGFWDVLSVMLRDQARMLRYALPEVGWMLIVLLVLVPWLATMLISSRALNEERQWSYYVLHVVFTAFTFAILGNVRISPWGMVSGSGGVPVLLYGLTAMVAGYLAAYWYLLLVNRRLMKVREVRDARVRAGVWLGYALTWPVILVVLAAALVNGFEASGRRGAFADRCAGELLDHLGGRRWLVGDGLLDNHLRLEARRRGIDLQILALQNNNNAVYIRMLKKVIDTDPEFAAMDRVRLRNAADLGVLSFLQDWLAAVPDLATRLAVMSAPDLLVGAGLTVVPNYLCFVGVRDPSVYKGEAFLSAYEPFWGRMEKILPSSRDRHDATAVYRASLRRQVGFVANNMGVLLEDLERRDEAFQVYQRVRKLDPENISALLNLAEMLNRDPKYRPEQKDAVEKDLKAFVENMPGRLPIWSLSRFYGYVRSPVLFAQLGWTWAMSGQPGMAMAGLKQAAAISPTTASRTRVKQAMAEVLMQQNEEEKSEAIYEEILRSEPQNQGALIAMARIATRRGTLDKAREWIGKAQAAGADKTGLALERAAIFLASGDVEQARLALTEVTEVQPKNLQAWAMLAVAMLQMNDLEAVERRVLPRMEAITGTPDNFMIQITRGQLHYRKGKGAYDAARDAFIRADALRPGLPMLMEWILRLDFLLDDKTQAERHARNLLRQNRDHAFANYIMGSLMLGQGKRAEAEDYLRRSVKDAKSGIALNDLAELLRETGNLAEAERQARAAIEMAPDLYVAWDTLGGVLFESKRLNEAEVAYTKALEIFQDDLRVHLNLAKLLKQKGNIVKAREMVNKILPRKLELPASEQEELTRLARELTPRM